MLKFNKLLPAAVGLIFLVLSGTCFAEYYDYIISEEFDEVPESFEINLNDFDMSGHSIYSEDSALYLNKAGDVGNPDIKASFEPIKENVVMEMEVSIDEGNFSLLDSKGQKVIDFYTRAGYDDQLEMRIDSATKNRFKYQRGDWCRMKFVIDLENDSFLPYLNDSDTPITTTWKLMGERDDVAAFTFVQKQAGKSSAIRYLKIYREPAMAIAKDIEYFMSNMLPMMENVSDDISLTQKAPLGSAISWDSEDEDVIKISDDGLTGIVTRGAEDTTVTLRATFSLNGIIREQDVDVVVARALSDAEKVQNAYDVLTLENTEYIAADFELPSMGFDNTQLEWVSSDADVLDIEGGKAVVKSISQDKTVTLTAKIISGEEVLKKAFTVGVLCDMGENLAKDADITPSTEISQNKASLIHDNDYYSAWCAVPVEAAPTLLIDLKEEKPVSHIRYRPYGSAGNIYNVYLSEDNINFTKKDTREYADGVRVIALDEIANCRYIKFEVENPNNTECGLYEAEICFMPTPGQIVDADLKDFSFDMISSEQTSSIKDDLKLVKSGKYGSVISYTSSDSDIIEIYKDEGIVRRPDGKADKNVTLTVTFSKDGISKDIKLSLVVIATGRSSSGGSSSGGGGGGSGSSGFRTYGTPTSGETQVPVETKPQEPIKPDDSVGKAYNDTSSVPWAEEYILELSEKGIVSGDGNGKFRPMDNVKREEFVLMLIKALDIELKSDGAVFNDVDEAHWSSQYVNTAASFGIVSGMEGNLFGIGRNITRQDMAVMIHRAIMGREYNTVSDKTAFADTEYVSDYAKDAVLVLSAAGLMNGDDMGNFSPLKSATRAETAVVIAKLIKLLR